MTAARCLVIGGSGALGRAVCEALAERGARVAITYHHNEAAARSIVDDIEGSKMIRIDLSRAGEAERAVDEAAAALDGIDALIHCAAIGIDQKMGDIDEAAWDRTMSINLKSAFFAGRRAAERMRGGGNIVLVGSVDGVKPAPSAVHYATSKAALGGMARSMAKELGASGVRVNVVAPGILEAGMSRALPAALRQDYLEHTASRRFGRLGEAAAVIAWLAVDNTYVTGQTLVVDGAL